MSPILVPTLSELRVELDRLEAVRATASAAHDANPEGEGLEQAWEATTDACWHVLDQIAALPAASLDDLRVKAHAFNWSASLLNGEPYHNPTDEEEQILRQIVAGLLDERIA